MPQPREDSEENIDYRSNVATPEAPDVSTQDEEDFSTLVHLVRLVQDAKGKCSSINLIDTAHPKLTAEQQAEAYQFCLNELILPFELSLMDAIGSVKRKQRGIK